MIAHIIKLLKHSINSNRNPQLSTVYLFGITSPRLTQEQNENRLYMSQFPRLMLESQLNSRKCVREGYIFIIGFIADYVFLKFKTMPKYILIISPVFVKNFT